MPIGVHVWSDPDDDGILDDAVLEASAAGVISDFTATNLETSTGFVDFVLPTVTFVPAGESFFVGLSLFDTGNVLAPARDTATDEGRSWIYRWNGDQLATAPANMGTATSQQNYDEIFGGNAMIRAVGVPEPSSLVLFGLGGFFAFLLRRKR